MFIVGVSRGDKQAGIDVVGTEDGKNKIAFQCKRRKQFTCKDAQEVIDKVTLEAEQYYLALSILASTKVRQHLAKNSGGRWRLWDARDLSNKIRNLPEKQAARLVNTYFPGVVEDFLGLPSSNPWFTNTAMPMTFGAGGRRHQPDIVGREGVMEKINELLDDDNKWLGLVKGQVGVGKTRLLEEFHQLAISKGFDVISMPRTKLTANDIQQLPTNTAKLLLLIDDAQDRDSDALQALMVAKDKNPQAKVILSTRPQHSPKIIADLKEYGLKPEVWEVNVLTDQQSIELSRAVLPGRNNRLVRQIAKKTGGLPFLIIQASNMIRNGEIDRLTLEGDNNLCDVVLARLRDRSIADYTDKRGLRSILNAVALLQPVDLEDRQFTDVLTEITELSRPDILEFIGRLEGFWCFNAKSRISTC